MTARLEHPLDRLARVHKETGRHFRWEPVDDESYRWITGKTAKKRWFYSFHPVSLLVDHECEICAKRGSGRTVRNCYVYADPIGWVPHAENKVFGHLCNGCRMTLEHARRKYVQCDELALNIRRFKRKQNESTKNNA